MSTDTLSPLQEEAVASWLGSTDSAMPLSAAEVAARFGRSTRWARDVVAAGRQRLAEAPELPAAEAEGELPPGPAASAVAEIPLPPPVAELLRAGPVEAVAEAALPPVAVAEAVAEDGRPSGRASAWLAFAVGTVASIAGNVCHAAILGGGIGSIIAAGFWPAALLISIETLTRVNWPAGAWFWLARWCGLTVVAAVAAAVSYSHLSALLALWDGGWMAVHAGPIAVDGMLTMGAAALLAVQRKPVTTDERTADAAATS